MKAKDVVYGVADMTWPIYVDACADEGSSPAEQRDWTIGFVCGFLTATKSLTGRAMKPDDIVNEEN